MKVHIIYNPNRNGPEVRVHRAGCRDIQRDIRGGRDWSPATSHYETAGFSQQEIAEDFHADFIEEGSMTAAAALDYCLFLPCTDGLPSALIHTCVAGPLCEDEAAWIGAIDPGMFGPGECQHVSCRAVIHEPCEACFILTMDGEQPVAADDQSSTAEQIRSARAALDAYRRARS